VDDEFAAAVEAQRDDLEEAAGSVEPQAQLPGGAVVVQVADEDGVLSGVDGFTRGDAVLSSRLVDLHAT